MDKVWFSWEDHRRSRELAKAFGAEYMLLGSNLGRPLRYINLSFLTLISLVLNRPSIVFCQNPSIVLATILVVFKKLFKYTLIVDRHSNFKFEHRGSRKIVWRIFWFLSKYTVRCADLTIVTNKDLCLLCSSWGGNSAVLPDKIPDLRVFASDVDAGPFFSSDNRRPKVVAITTFDSDEPIPEMLGAARILGDEFDVFFTGNYKKYFKDESLRGLIPENVTMLGFIPEASYRLALNDADVILVLTNKELILNCGAYEAVSVHVPMVIANTKTMTSYFYKGAVSVNLDSISIASGVRECYGKKDVKKREVQELRVELEKDWVERFNEILENVEAIRCKGSY